MFAPNRSGNSKYRARVTPAKRCRGCRHATTADQEQRTSAERRAAMTWEQRLKRVFGIDVEHERREENAWRVYLDSEGNARWETLGQVRARQPARSFWQRVQRIVFMAFSRDLY